MSIIVLLPHGETSSPNGYLTCHSCLVVIKTTVVIPSVLPRPPGGYQSVLCGSENVTKQTAILVAEMLHTKIEACPALGETIEQLGLSKLATGLIDRGCSVIAVSHQKTIEALIETLFSVSGRQYSDTRSDALGYRKFFVIDTDKHTVRSVEAPKKILLL